MKIALTSSLYFRFPFCFQERPPSIINIRTNIVPPSRVQTSTFQASKQTRIPRAVDFCVQNILFDSLACRVDHLLEPLHAVKRCPEAFPDLARARRPCQIGRRRFAIPHTEDSVCGAFDGCESDSIFGFVSKGAFFMVLATLIILNIQLVLLDLKEFAVATNVMIRG